MRGGVLLDRKTGRPVVDERLRIQLADRPQYLERIEKLIGRAIEFPGLVATERNPPLYMDVSNAYSGDELGLPNRDMISEGIVGATDLAVSAHGGANSVDVAAGAAWVLGDTTPNAQPNYRVYNDAIVNLGINPDPTNPRRVLVGAQITDQGFAGTGRTWALTAIHGTPAGSPVLPATPASFLPLSDITVPAAAASSAAYTFTDLRKRAIVGAGQAVAPMTVLYDSADAGVSFPVASVTTSTLDSTNFPHLRVCWESKSDQAAAQNFLMQVNGLASGYDYAYNTCVNNANTPSSSIAATAALIGAIPGTGSANSLGVGTVDIINRQVADGVHIVCWVFQAFQAGTFSVATMQAVYGGGTYGSSGAITSIKFLAPAGNLAAPSRFTVYGMVG